MTREALLRKRLEEQRRILSAREAERRRREAAECARRWAGHISPSR
jgi:hypothetical protein